MGISLIGYYLGQLEQLVQLEIPVHTQNAEHFHHRATEYELGRVSPFGHRRIKASRQLPDAFRSLARPSSVLHTKASTVCVNKRLFKSYKKLTL